MRNSIRSEIVDLSDKNRRFLEVRIDITNQCNLKCRMCYFSLEAKKYERVHFMDPEKFRFIAEQIFPYSSIVLVSCGAEPLVHPEFNKILKCAKKYTRILGFSTNWQLLNEDISKLCIDLPVEIIIFSIDSAKSETFNWIRRGASFERVINNIKKLNKLKRKGKNSFPKLKGNIVLMKKNIEELPDIVKLGKELGFVELNAEFMRIYDGLQMEEQSLENDSELARKYIEESREIADKLGIPFNAPGISSEDNPKFQTVCERPWNFINIWPSGDVVPCDGWRGAPPLGNLFNTNFEKIWNGSAYKNLRKSIINGINLNSPCRACNAFLSKKTSPDIFKKKDYVICDTNFTSAAEAGNLNRIIELLKEGHHVDEYNTMGETALLKAATRSDIEMMKFLIYKGADLNRASFRGITPLIAAALNNHTEAVEFLLDQDADINLQNENGLTVLMVVCEKGLTDVMNLLLKRNARLNLQNAEGFSALMTASRNNNFYITKKLIEKGADISIKNKKGLTALELAQNINSTSIVELLTGIK